MKRQLLILLTWVLSSFAFAEPELKGTPNDLRGFLFPEQDIVSIYGDAQETAYADIAILSLVVTTENKLLFQSLSKNAEIRKVITDSLIRSGVTADKIKSSEFSSSPEYGWFSREPTSHKVVNRMAIEITQESQLMDVALFADRCYEVELADTAFKHSKKEAYNARVREKALASVIKQQKHYEETLGLKLSPIGIREASLHQQSTRGARMMEEVVVTADLYDSGGGSSAKSRREYPREQPFDEVEYRAGVWVDFKIEPKVSAK
jgi:uncharacterized protein YggE